MNPSRFRRSLHRACMAVIAVLYVISVPWYRDGDSPLRVLIGLPDWVAVALLCYVGVAVVNAIAWTVTEVPDEPDPSGLHDDSRATGDSEAAP